MTKRVLIAGCYHETNTFLDIPTGFDRVQICRGEAFFRRRGDGSTIAAFLQVADRHGWQVIPTIEFSAMPSGAIDHAVFEAFWEELRLGLETALLGGLDAIWLGLHGAMVTTESLDPEGALLARLRAVPGVAGLPIFGVFDLHATFTSQMAAHANGLVGYRENPHIDAAEAAACSAELLARCLDTGVIPHMTTRRFPIVWPPTGTGTADEPMRSLEASARAIEASDPAVWAVNIVGGYSFADTPDTGVSASLIADGPLQADHLAALEVIAVTGREAGVPREWRLDAALDDAIAKRAAGLTAPVLIVEPADNIGGGATGDCTTVLRAFLDRKLTHACVVIADAAAVAALANTPIGATQSVAIGGSLRHLDPGPISLPLTVVSRSDGRFTLEDRQSHLAALNGIFIDMGPSVTTQVDGVTILITSRKTPPFDLGQLRSQGITPETLHFINVKAAVAHRRAYDRIAGASYWVATPGPCPSDLTYLPYKHLSRPIFPLDPPWRPA